MSNKVNITVELRGDIIIKTDKEKINENTSEIKSCIFCKSGINLICKKGIYICTDCIESLKNAKAGDYFY